MKKSKVFSAVLALAIVLCGLAWGTRSNSSEPMKGASTSATWTEYFESVDEMAENADIGIVGVLYDSETELRSDIVFTRNIVEVVEVYSGDVQVGDLVEVLQTGGVYGDISTPAFSEVPLMEKNKEYALFLSETEPHEVYGQYYLIKGGYQGIADISAVATPWTVGEEAFDFTNYFVGNFD